MCSSCSNRKVRRTVLGTVIGTANAISLCAYMQCIYGLQMARTIVVSPSGDPTPPDDVACNEIVTYTTLTTERRRRYEMYVAGFARACEHHRIASEPLSNQ